MRRTIKGSSLLGFVSVIAATLTLSACGGDDMAKTAAQTDDGTPPEVSAPSTANTPPAVSGTPSSTAAAGKAYTFQPSASDADKDAITFTIANKPLWAQFNTQTGQLTGTPTVAQAGVYKDVEIAATDGKDVSALPTFAITVTKASSTTQSVSLDWQAPSQNTDGTPLVDLKGYKLHYGNTSKAYSTTVDLNTPGVQTYMVDNLSSGTYFFAVTAYNAAGVESEYSSEVRATLN